MKYRMHQTSSDGFSYLTHILLFSLHPQRHVMQLYKKVRNLHDIPYRPECMFQYPHEKHTALDLLHHSKLIRLSAKDIPFCNHHVN